MKHDPFEFLGPMTLGERVRRIAFLLVIIAALAYDLLIGRPG